jgi:hypothetical protein
MLPAGLQESPMADETYVRNGLAPYAERVRLIVERGYNDWLKSSDRPKLIFERSRANVRFDHIARHAQIEFGSEKGVRVIAENETVKLLFCSGTILLRYKHADEDGLGANIVTPSILEFIDADRQPLLPGMPDLHKVECNFRQNDLDTALESVVITARHMRKKLWSYELAKPEAEILPFAPSASPAPTRPEVRPRQTRKDAEKDPKKDSKKD